MAGLYSITTRDDGTVLTATIYMADHQIHVDNLSINMMGISYSDSGYDATTDPQSGGSRSKPTHLQGQLERLAHGIHQLKQSFGLTVSNWWNTFALTGTPSSSTYLRGDGSWQAVATSDTLTSHTTTPQTVAAATCNGRNYYNNEGASSTTIEYDLPSSANDLVMWFDVVDSGGITLDPNGTEILVVEGTSLGAGVALTCKTIGARIGIFAISGGWNVVILNNIRKSSTKLASTITTSSSTYASTTLSLSVVCGISGNIRIDFASVIYPNAAGGARAAFRINRDSGTEYIGLGRITEDGNTAEVNFKNFHIFGGLTKGTSYTFLMEWASVDNTTIWTCDGGVAGQTRNMIMSAETW